MDKSMKAGGLAAFQRDCWRKIAITPTTLAKVASDRSWCKRLWVLKKEQREGSLWGVNTAAGRASLRALES